MVRRFAESADRVRSLAAHSACLLSAPSCQAFVAGPPGLAASSRTNRAAAEFTGVVAKMNSGRGDGSTAPANARPQERRCPAESE